MQTPNEASWKLLVNCTSNTEKTESIQTARPSLLGPGDSVQLGPTCLRSSGGRSGTRPLAHPPTSAHGTFTWCPSMYRVASRNRRYEMKP